MFCLRLPYEKLSVSHQGPTETFGTHLKVVKITRGSFKKKLSVPLDLDSKMRFHLRLRDGEISPSTKSCQNR